jgi:F-type H+-transporting ATPase subunit delta
MAELATIARPYAEALFKSAKADLGAAAAWLEPLAAVAGNEQLQQFASNPKVTDQQVFDVIAGVAKTALPETAKNFLRTVIENGRLEALPEIAAQFRALKNAQAGSSDAVVYSAFPVDAAALAEPVGRAGKAVWPQAQRPRRAGRRADRRYSRGGGRRGARHFGQGPSGTNENGADRLTRTS